ncbi:hypothetical protein NFH98_20940 [Halomonas sp. H33-56]|uniref:hypothetical protein n=1 Tax=Halomonas sp. H33-56 TaxID=2950873 RepID=UPI0032DFB699
MAAPSKKPNAKGAPPQAGDKRHVVGNNTRKPEAGEKTTFNTRVPPEWKKRLKMFAVAHDVDMQEVMIEAVTEYLDKKGG